MKAGGDEVAADDAEVTPVPKFAIPEDIAAERAATERGFGEAAIGAIAEFKAFSEAKHKALASNVQTLHEKLRSEADLGVRRHAQVMTAISTVLTRVDKNEQDDAATRAAVSEVHRVAHAAQEQLSALGAQVGTTAAELAPVRERMATLHDHDLEQTAQLAVIAREKRAQKFWSRAQVVALAGAGAIFLKLIEFVYHLTHPGAPPLFPF